MFLISCNMVDFFIDIFFIGQNSFLMEEGFEITCFPRSLLKKLLPLES